ncbi:MAG: hypothetical protein N2235_05675 [Fischerella sp.]|nr:hypothetical protein [Fischerella sp.]
MISPVNAKIPQFSIQLGTIDPGDRQQEKLKQLSKDCAIATKKM